MEGHDEHIAVRVSGRIVEYAVCGDGSMPARDFINSLSTSSKSRLLAIFRQVASTQGRGVPPPMFKHERGDLWTFKCKENKRRIRMPCFRKGDRWIITHGFFKPPKSKWDEQEFTRAFEIMREVSERESKGKKHREGRD